MRSRVPRARALDAAPSSPPPRGHRLPGPPAPEAAYVGLDELLALCLCEASFVWVPPAAVKAGAVYCERCQP